MKTIGMIGSRRRNTPTDYCRARLAFFRVYELGDTLVSGGCPVGGDHFLERIAQSLSLRFHTLQESQALFTGDMNIHPALWNTYGRRAGFHRNGYIARDSDVLIALVSADRTGGTEDTIRKYLALGKDSLILI